MPDFKCIELDGDEEFLSFVVCKFEHIIHRNFKIFGVLK